MYSVYIIFIYSNVFGRIRHALYRTQVYNINRSVSCEHAAHAAQVAPGPPMYSV